MADFPSEQTFPPGPATSSPLGHLFNFARDPLQFLIQVSAQYGDLAHFKIRKRDVYLVSHPDEIERILVTHAGNFVKNPGFQTIKRVLGEGLLSSEGEFHLRQRRMMQPAFHRRRIASYAQVMADETSKVSSRWRSGGEIDVFREMVELTLRVVSRALFSTDLEDQAGEISQAVDDAMTLFHQATSPVSLLLSRLPWVGDRRFRRGRKRLDEAIFRLIRKRRESGNRADDLLSALIDAQEEGSRMTDAQVRDEALTILLAGHETTATALAWTWYLLSRHPEAETALHEELDCVLQGRPPAVEDLPNLVYTRMVFTEALRLYPPVYMLGRQALQDYPIRSYVIPAGASLIISPYLVHHDPRYYPNPERFDPLRWAPEAQAGRHKYAYLPFSAGPRVCIGEPFAWQEGVMVLATLGQRWKLSRPSDEPVLALPRVTLRPKGGIRMTLRPRL